MTWLYLGRTVQKEIPLYERHDGETMGGANYFVFENERHITFFSVLNLQVFCSFVLT